MQNNTIYTVAFLLLVVGGLNWLLVGVLNFDLVMWVFVDLLNVEILAKVVYVLVGLSAVYVLLMKKGGDSAASKPADPVGDITHG